MEMKDNSNQVTLSFVLPLNQVLKLLFWQSYLWNIVQAHSHSFHTEVKIHYWVLDVFYSITILHKYIDIKTTLCVKGYAVYIYYICISLYVFVYIS